MKSLSEFLREYRTCKTVSEEASDAFFPKEENIKPIYYSVGTKNRVFAY